MKVKELIEALKQYNPEADFVVNVVDYDEVSPDVEDMESDSDLEGTVVLQVYINPD